MNTLPLALVGVAATALGLGVLLAQPADTGGPGAGSRDPREGGLASRPASHPGMHQGAPNGPARGFPHLIPPFAAEKMKLTEEQRKQLEELAKETKAKLDKILTPEQQKILEEARSPHPEQGPGGPGGPGDPGGAADHGDRPAGGPGGHGGPGGPSSRPAGPPPPPAQN